MVKNNKKVLRKSAKKSVKKSIKKVTRKSVKKSTKKVTRKSVKKSTKKVTRKSVKKSTRKSSKKPVNKDSKKPKSDDFKKPSDNSNPPLPKLCLYMHPNKTYIDDFYLEMAVSCGINAFTNAQQLLKNIDMGDRMLPEVTIEEIKKKVRILSMKYHPDKHPENIGIMAGINSSAECLIFMKEKLPEFQKNDPRGFENCMEQWQIQRV